MAWFRMEASFRDHRKVKRLARRLECSLVEARGYLAGLLCSVADESPDGSLEDWETEDIADAANWEGDAERFVEALRQCGWVDDGECGPEVHGFLERAESHRAAVRARNYRQRKKEQERAEREKTASRDGHETGASRITRASQGRTDETGRDEDGTDGRTDQGSLSVSSASPPDPDGADPPSRAAEEVQAVFEHYRKYHPRAHKRPSSRSKEWRNIRARLNEGYSVEDLKQAIDGCHVSPFHMGENDRGKRYDSLELITRDGSKVQQFLEAYDARGSPVLGEKTKRSMRAGKAWLERHGHEVQA